MEEMRNGAHLVMDEVRKVIVGKDGCIEKVMAAILAGGNVLLEDVPGVGKTEMAIAFSRAMGLKSNRVQFTPDVMPADITGFSVYSRETERFVYRPGAAMCNLLLADEINRTSPKTQSALLEAMEEQMVTVDGISHPVPSPFIVIATQNPFGSAGTWMLPEAQLDRFMVCLQLGYPNIEDEIDILKGKQNQEEAQAVISTEELQKMQEEADWTHVTDEVYRYAGGLVRQTRNHPMIDLGISPRGAINIVQMAKAMAYLRKRKYVVPEDVQDVFLPVCNHRLMLNAKARAANMGAEQILKEIQKSVPVPRAL